MSQLKKKNKSKFQIISISIFLICEYYLVMYFNEAKKNLFQWLLLLITFCEIDWYQWHAIQMLCVQGDIYTRVALDSK